MKHLISIFLFLMMHSIFAAPIGTVLFTAKKVTAKRGGAERPLTRGAALEAGDTIVTAAEAVAKIRYLNGTLVTIGASSVYTILAYAPEQSDVTINAELKKGKIESETNGGAKRQSLKTPVVALAITGTVFKAYVSCNNKKNDAACDKKTYVELISGQVTAGDRVMQPGESILATPAGIVDAPFPNAGTIPITPEMKAATSAEVESVGGADTSVSTKADTESNIASTSATETSFVSTAVVASATVSTDTVVTPPPVAPEATFDIICPTN